jgi:hypothetical protein
MKIKQFIASVGLVAVALSVQATTISFDGQLKNNIGTTQSGTGGTILGADVYGPILGFGDFTVTTGYSNNLNLASSNFSMTDIIQKNNRNVYQDINPGNGGLGAFTKSGRSGDTDNLNSNLGGGSNFDEVLFFDFKQEVLLNTFWFNGNHKEKVSTSGKGARFNIFKTTDGTNYSSLFNGQKKPTNAEYLSPNLTTAYSQFAVAMTGWGDQGGYVEAIQYTSVSAPATIALLGLGLVGFGFTRRKKVLSK